MKYARVIPYFGYGSSTRGRVMGHIIRKYKIKDPKNGWWRAPKNMQDMMKRFRLKGVGRYTVAISIYGKRYTTISEEDGFFELEMQLDHLPEGWHDYEVYVPDLKLFGQGELFITQSKMAVISDIDDTFLISHALKKWKKLPLLLFKNALNRKPFLGRSKWYNRLAKEGTQPLFYISSSEWNLFDFLRKFVEHHQFPKGVFLLNRLKSRWGDLIQKQGEHHQLKKFYILQLLADFPEMKFMLIGDSGQQDMQIYQDIASHSPQRISAILIHQLPKTSQEKVRQFSARINALDISFHLFQSSKEAESYLQNNLPSLIMNDAELP
ncbi:App1 family protein [Persicobacter sp. CCB-QB2]|uniref:App1 family protein n=1 Tax=Persicobacter sp. CCB-QB2 TaxID=1561025 RepID=UPI0009E38D45|nr:phosphatase domain-containing protein [Persicobacter sp. CCB-QB2]